MQRMDILSRLQDALQRRREVEVKIEAELQKVQDAMKQMLRVVSDAVDEVERVAVAVERQDVEMDL